MKLISFFTIKILLILSVICIANSLKGINITLAKNQLSAFPDTYKAPVSKEDVLKAKYEPPRLSQSLKEMDPKKRFKKSEFLQWIHYAQYKLTRGEAEIIFQFADRNKDDLLDMNEWEDFTTLYILPFDACDFNNDFLLDDKEFKTCFNADPKSITIQFRKKYLLGGNPTKYIVDTLSTRGTSHLNLADYIFYRRALYGWRDCHSTPKYIAKSNFRCALQNSIPQKYQLKLDNDKIYDSGLRHGNDVNLIQLDFIAYLKVLHYYYIFATFGHPMSLPYLEKAQFMRALHEDRLPNNWEESEIELIYNLTNDGKFMDFNSFCFFYNLHRLFNKYSIKTPLKLHIDELLLLLKDLNTPVAIQKAIDLSFTNFTQPEYQEASLVLGKKRLNEKGFFFSFKSLQDSSEITNGTGMNMTKVHNNTLDQDGIIENRKMFFTIMSGVDRQFWSKTNFYRAFLLSNFFVQMGIGNIGILAEKLQTYYDTVSPTINTDQRKNHNFYKNMPKELDVDLLTFLNIENFLYKIDDHKSTKDNVISETKLKKIMKDLGMENMPDTVIDLAKKGYDAVRRRMYHINDAIKFTTIVQAAAAELRRAKHTIDKFKIKPNFDLSRPFGDGSPRRFLSSPMI